MMQPNDKKERFSLAYIAAVAAHAGFDLVEPKVDRDSIDGTLISHFGRRPRIDFQAKATARGLLGDDLLKFPLSVKNYDDLRIEVIVPRMLVVVVLPNSEDAWLTQSEEKMVLRHCGYWATLADEPETNNRSTVTIEIPRSQRFDSATLTTLMMRASSGRLT